MAKTARTVLELVTNIDEYIADLKKGEKSNDEFDKSAQKIGKGFQSVGKDISSFGTGLSTYVTLPIAGVVAGAGALIMSMADSADAIAKNAREAGLSAEAYQELKYAVGQVGKLTEEQVDGAFRKLTGTIGEAAAGSDKAKEALLQLGYTQKEIESGSISTEDAFNRLNKSMQGATSQAEAAALAGEFVGDKIGPSLAAALRTSGKEVDALRGQFKELGLGMSQDALDGAEALQDDLDTLGREITAVGHSIAAEFLPVLRDELIPFVRTEVVPRIREFGQWLSSLAQGFANLSPGMQTFIGGSIAMVAAVGPVLIIVGKLVTAFGTVLPAAIGATNGALAFFAANPVALAALAIAGAFVAVKIAADDSTAAIRRQIQVANDYKTISDLFNKTTALTADEQTRLKAALERTEKQTYINSKGLGTLGTSTTGLKVDLEELSLELDENASPAMRRTKAELERLKKAQEEAAKATGKHNEELKQQSDLMTGKKLQKDMEQLALVVGKWTDADRKWAIQNSDVTKQVEEFRAKGLTLPPVLHAIWLENERLHPSLKVSTDALAGFSDVMANMPSYKLGTPPKALWDQWKEDAKSFSGDGSGIFDPDLFDLSEATQAQIEQSAKDASDSFAGRFGEAISGLGDVIVNAISGGGDVGRAAGASVGQFFGNELSTWLQKEIPGRLGKLIGGFAGPLGALVGSALGGLVDKIFSGNDTKKGREALARSLGFPTLAAMNADLQKFGADGAKLVNDGLNKIGKTDTAANEEWIQSVKDLYKAKADAKIAEAEAAAAFNAQAEEMIPNWKTAGELAEKYGIDIAALGTKFQQGGLSEATQEIYTDFQRLAAFIGEDMNEGVLRGMSDEISQLVAKSLSFGGEIPKQMEPMIRKLEEMGLLVDENGNKLEGVENLKFGETMQETTLSLIEAMKDLAKVMRGDISDSIKGVKDLSKVVAGDMRKMFSEPIPITFDFDTSGAPDFKPDRPGGGDADQNRMNFGMERWHARYFSAPTSSTAAHESDDYAFSNVASSFRSNSERPIVLNGTFISKINNREVAREQIQVWGEALRQAGG